MKACHSYVSHFLFVLSSGRHQCRVHPQAEVSAAESLSPPGGVWGSALHVGPIVQWQPGWVGTNMMQSNTVTIWSLLCNSYENYTSEMLIQLFSRLRYNTVKDKNERFLVIHFLWCNCRHVDPWGAGWRLSERQRQHRLHWLFCFCCWGERSAHRHSVETHRYFFFMSLCMHMFFRKLWKMTITISFIHYTFQTPKIWYKTKKISSVSHLRAWNHQIICVFALKMVSDIKT